MTILKRRQQITWRSLCAKAPLVAAMWALQSGVPLQAQDFVASDFTDGFGPNTLRTATFNVNADAAVQDDRILLSAGTYKLTQPLIALGPIYGDLDITRSPAAGSVTIIGAGVGVTIIDANSIDRVLSITNNAKVILKNLTLTGGLAKDSGNASGNGKFGGAIFSYGGTLTLDTVSIENCATLNGQGYFGLGGAVYTSGGSLTIINSTLKGNQAVGGVGAAGALGNPFATGGAGGSGNAAMGGAIYSSGTTVSISGSTISSNSAVAGAGGRGGDARTGYGSYGGGIGGLGGIGLGGGIFAAGGSLTLSNSTVSSNTVQGGKGGDGGTGAGGAAGGNGGNGPIYSLGGGVYIGFSTPGTINNTTIAFNNALTAAGGAGGSGGTTGAAGTGTSGIAGGLAVNLVLLDFASAATRAPGPTPVTLSSTLISNNTAATQPDSGGTITSQGYNLIGNASGSTGFTQPTDITGKDPLLDVLANNGGPTFTHALKTGSPAIDKGLANGLTFDQRGTGYPRVVGSTADIGAFEFQAPPPPSNPPVITSGPTATPDNPIVNEVVTFFVSGAGNVTWNFGDGSTGSGDTTTHQYAVPGTYTVIVTLTDPNTGQTVTAQMTVTVHGTPFRVSRATVKLSTGHDKVTMTGIVHIPAGVAIGGKTFLLSLGTTTLSFVLDSHGKGTNSSGKLKVSQKSMRSQEANFTATVTGDFLAGLKVAQPLDSNGLPTQLAIGAQFVGAYYDANNLPIDPTLLFSIPVKFVNNTAKFNLLAPIKK